MNNGINLTEIQKYSNALSTIINYYLIPGLIAIALITFLIGVYRYFILGADSDSSRETGRQFIFWGIIGFVVIISVWGLVAIVGITLGLGAGGGSPPPPTIGPQ